jgi:hypothetical protein
VKRSICLAAAVAGALLIAAPASAAVRIGSDDALNTVGGGTCPGTPATIIQIGSPNGEYAMPFDGVLTSWTSGTDVWTSATFKAVRLGAGNSFTILAEDGPRSSNGIYNPIRVPVLQGDVIGLSAVNGCFSNREHSGYTTAYIGSQVGPGTHSYSAGVPGFKIPVTAQLERDADNDGFGDETQDGCPSDASTQGACPPDIAPPDTSIARGPAKKTKKKTATFEFSSTEAGSSFECSLDGAAFAPCSSPVSLTVRKAGKHNLLVRARDAAGNLDTTEASYSWTLKKKKKKRKKK